MALENTMPIPSVIGDLSTTAASNYPQGTDSPSTLDDVQRAHGSFIAQLATGVASQTAKITGGTINGATVGATTPSTGAFTTLSATGDTVLSGTDGKIIAGTAAGRAIWGNSNTATYAVAYGASHATNANQFTIVTNGNVTTQDASGNLGIGGAGSGTNGAGYVSKLTLTGTNTALNIKSAANTDWWLGGTGGSLVFYDNISAAERGRFDGSGNLTPGANGTQAFGSTSLRWSQVWCTAGAFNTSDARLKTEVTLLNEAEKKAAAQFSKEIGTFQWLDSVQIKGPDKARHHVGFTVQRAQEILESFGLDPWRYGFMSYDAWDDEFVEHPAIEAVEAVAAAIDEDGKVITPAVEAVEAKAAWTEQTKKAGDAYAFRYDQLNLFVAAGISYRLTVLENK